MKNLLILAFLSGVVVTSNIAHAQVQAFSATADVITVLSPPVVDHLEIFSLAKARQAIDETQARVQAEIKARANSALAQSTRSTSSSDAS